jgi:hypothetical protein
MKNFPLSLYILIKSYFYFLLRIKMLVFCIKFLHIITVTVDVMSISKSHIHPIPIVEDFYDSKVARLISLSRHIHRCMRRYLYSFEYIYVTTLLQQQKHTCLLFSVSFVSSIDHLCWFVDLLDFE